MGPAKSQTPIEIQEQLMRMPEWERLNDIRQFGLSLEIFQRNAGELTRLLESVRSPEVATKLWAVQNRQSLAGFQREVARLLHNFVSAAFALVDHARHFFKKQYEGKDFLPEYDAEVKTRFAEEPLCQFVQGLRNFSIHKQVPNITTSLSIVPGKGMSNDVYLKKSELLDFGWNAKAKAYLAAAPDNLDLLELSSSYSSKVDQFYQWVSARLSVVHADDLEAVGKVQNQLRSAMGQTAASHFEAALEIGSRIRTPPEDMFLPFVEPDLWRKAMATGTPTEQANALMDAVEQFAPPLGELRARIVEAFERYHRTSR